MSDKAGYEEEQRRLDRLWYGMDEGQDDENSAFSGMSEEYTRKKEEQLEQKKKKRMSEQQRQIHKVSKVTNIGATATNAK